MTTIEELKRSYPPFGEKNARFTEYFSGMGIKRPIRVGTDDLWRD